MPNKIAKPNKQKHNLIVVAHPDDETIYFGALMLARRRLPWTVVCVTDGNADGMGQKRRRQFMTACKLLKAERAVWLGFPDIFKQRLEVDRLVSALQDLPEPASVFTHSIVGDYGHPHHQDVCFAVHRAFEGRRSPVHSVAYNCFPDFTVRINRTQYDLKTQILSKVYGSETRRFANLLPATASEGFARLSFAEILAIYRYFTAHKTPPRGALNHYKWFWSYMKSANDLTARRLF
jgi:LmbE family N-acetylglucosaminyl deacetylase